MNLRESVVGGLGHPVHAVSSTDAQPAARAGVLYAVGAYGLWGVFPIYFKVVRHVPALEVLAHRIIWSLALLLVLIAARHDWPALRAALRQRRTFITLLATTLLIAANWLLFIWAVAHDYVLQASLGYFINPLVNVLLGFVFLRERLRRWQTVAVILAASGVGYMTVAGGCFPGMALFLAGSFGFYGLLRKVANVEALIGLTIETGLLTPPALAFLSYRMVVGQAVFGSRLDMSLILLLAGVITATPLLWFSQAARRLRLATLGFIQYLSPTGHFVLAVVAFGEPFTSAHLVTFGCIWVALAIYTIDTARAARPSAVSAASNPPLE